MAHAIAVALLNGEGTAQDIADRAGTTYNVVRGVRTSLRRLSQVEAMAA
jgi:hypothetical protein